MARTKLEGNIRLTSVSVQRDDGQSPTFRMQNVICEPLTGSVGEFDVRADCVSVQNMRTPEAGKADARAAADHVIANNIVITGRGIELHIERVALERGGRIDSDDITVPSLVLERVSFVISDILGMRSKHRGDDDQPGDDQCDDRRDARRENAGDRAAAGDGPGSRASDLAFLDALEGYLNVDLYLDVTVPVLGQRSETHAFRIPIRAGTIDYEALESDVNWLARSVLDIELVGDKLVLEKDLPLVPWDNKALLVWRLSPDEQALARKHRVRLRTLLNWEIPGGDRSKSSSDDNAAESKKPRKKSISFHHIATRNIDLSIGMRGGTEVSFGHGGVIQFGDEQIAGVTDLSISGVMEHMADRPAPDTALYGTMQALAASVRDYRIGPRRLSAGRIHIESVNEVSLGFTGFRPGRLTGTIGRIAVDDLRITASD